MCRRVLWIADQRPVQIFRGFGHGTQLVAGDAAAAPGAGQRAVESECPRAIGLRGRPVELSRWSVPRSSQASAIVGSSARAAFSSARAASPRPSIDRFDHAAGERRDHPARSESQVEIGQGQYEGRRRPDEPRHSGRVSHGSDEVRSARCIVVGRDKAKGRPRRPPSAGVVVDQNARRCE